MDVISIGVKKREDLTFTNSASFGRHTNPPAFQRKGQRCLLELADAELQ